MKILISAVGDTDPIRNFHDGPLLHIVRVYRPEKIVLVHSERSLTKHDKLVKALKSIKDYSPEIIQDGGVLPDEQVAIFDKMYDTVSSIVKKYISDDEIILNISSATPQIISAMFAVNRISDFNVTAVQVMTPQQKSNEGLRHDNQEDIDTLIETNLDNQSDYENRTLKDTGSKFSQDLTKRNLKALIDNYDYQGALELLKKQKSFSNIKELRKKLTEISDTIKIQGMPDKIVKANLSTQAKSALNSYLNIDRNHKQGNIAEVLIRVKSLVEFILENYLNNHFLDVITYKEDGKPFLNASKYPEILKKFQEDAKTRDQEYHSGYLSLPAYIGILKFFEPNHDLLKHIYKIQEINQVRNQVAHSLQAFDRKNLKKVSSAVFASKQILLASFDIDNHWFSFYEDLNQEIKKLL
ncbi:type III-A CRISPR-associated CARF protein Csm6 [Lactococcus raffinolactis]|uniref:type III-A CRISPR-associated CARF protein Csm6 n=1 Tax=Pseudolactococcus raffinolactis TaxID=1366 RepID=UPI001108F871|nr:type III-A CRISPR-associated CARF protein Csm6 [Lactococcus raffinolactis]TLQ11941.1 type III-A CRISPR-associated protein Csm6 [Lactococcus raffinolactis]